MDNLCRYSNFLITHSMSIGIQVTMIFTFLTVFFFLYVVKVEKDEFANQLNIVVDNVMERQPGDPTSYITQTGSQIVPKKDLEIAILGLLDETRRNQDINDIPDDMRVNSQNESIKIKATKSLLYVWGVLIFVILVLYIFGICISLGQTIKESKLLLNFLNS